MKKSLNSDQSQAFKFYRRTQPKFFGNSQTCPSNFIKQIIVAPVSMGYFVLALQSSETHSDEWGGFEATNRFVIEYGVRVVICI